jgi:hypothetical protein
MPHKHLMLALHGALLYWRLACNADWVVHPSPINNRFGQGFFKLKLMKGPRYMGCSWDAIDCATNVDEECMENTLSRCAECVQSCAPLASRQLSCLLCRDISHIESLISVWISDICGAQRLLRTLGQSQAGPRARTRDNLRSAPLGDCVSMWVWVSARFNCGFYHLALSLSFALPTPSQFRVLMAATTT